MGSLISASVRFGRPSFEDSGSFGQAKASWQNATCCNDPREQEALEGPALQVAAQTQTNCGEDLGGCHCLVDPKVRGKMFELPCALPGRPASELWRQRVTLLKEFNAALAMIAMIDAERRATVESSGVNVGEDRDSWD